MRLCGLCVLSGWWCMVHGAWVWGERIGLDGAWVQFLKRAFECGDCKAGEEGACPP